MPSRSPEQIQWLHDLAEWSLLPTSANILRRSFNPPAPGIPNEWTSSIWLDGIFASSNFPQHLAHTFLTECDLRPGEELVQIWKDSELAADFIVQAYKRKPGYLLSSTLAEAFKAPLVGDICSRFLNDVDQVYSEIYSPDHYYGRVIALVNSSGTGKSFMVKSLRDQGEELAGAFLGALFATMAEILESYPLLASFNEIWDTNHPEPMPESHPGLPTREQTFRAVATLTDTCLEVTPWENLRHANPTIAAWSKTIFHRVVKPQLKRLCSVTQSLLPGTKIFIALDECAQLNAWGIPEPVSHPSEAASHITLIAMQRIMKACEDIPDCWFLLLNTHASVSDLHPPKSMSALLRLRTLLDPLPPWPYFDFDIMIDPDQQVSPQDALSLTHLKCYGRPLWQQLIPQFNSNILQFAVSKLIGQSTVTSQDEDVSDAAVYALLSKRVLPSLAGDNSTASRIASEALKNRPFVGGAANEPTVTTITLFEFFSTLLPPSTHSELLPEFRDYVVNFTHFVQLGGNIKLLTANLLYEAWSRGAAFQCAFGQSIFDILIIAYRKSKLNDPFDANFCYISSFQIKFKEEAATTALAQGLTIPLIYGSTTAIMTPLTLLTSLNRLPLTKLKHVVILMDLENRPQARNFVGTPAHRITVNLRLLNRLDFVSTSEAMERMFIQRFGSLLLPSSVLTYGKV
ncbi:hypothetical protein ONZ45_g6444 [Pleurotus djamor]|nr:hypothetical protein ONZ45_g6444 [Pleurotus djamor]